MWTPAQVRLCSLLCLLSLDSKFNFLDCSPLHSCRTREQFNLSRMHKDGDVVLGGLFEIHFFSVFPDASFTSKPQPPNCHG